MAITTVAGAISGMMPPYSYQKVTGTMKAAGVLHSTMYVGNAPAAGSAPSPGIAGAALTSYTGQIPWTNPASGNSYLAKFDCCGNNIGRLWVFDRLWHNSGISSTTTTGQTVNSVAWPARDKSGSTNGVGVMVGIEVSTATTNAGAISNMTMSYTNQAGTAGQTATMSSFPATASAGTFVLFQLAAGDTGVRSIQSLTLGTSLVTGTVHLVAIRTLAQMTLQNTTGAQLDAISSGFPRLYDNTTPFLLWNPISTTAVTLTGMMGVTQG